VTAVVRSTTETLAVSPPPSEVITGASSTGLTVRLMVAMFELNVPSVALNWKLSGPLKFAAGV